VSSGDRRSLTIDDATDYQLTCKNAAGESSSTATIQLAQAPTIVGLLSSPALAPAGATKALLSWRVEGGADPAPRCFVDGKEVASGDIVDLPATLPLLPRQLALRCENIAGEDTKTLLIPTLPPLPASIPMPGPGTYALGPLSVVVPENALPGGMQTLTVKWLENYTPRAGLLTAPLELGPDGAAFQNPLQFTFPYDPTALAALGITDPLRQLGASHLGGDGWNKIRAEIDTANRTITAYVSHFSSIAYDTTRDDKEKKPTRSAFQVVARAEEFAHWKGATGTVYQDYEERKKAGISSQIATGLPRPCAGKQDVEVVELLGADVDADGRQEWVALCLYTAKTTGSSTNKQRHTTFRIEVLDDAEGQFALLKAIDGKTWAPAKLANDRFFFKAHLAIGNVDDDLGDELIVAVSRGYYKTPYYSSHTRDGGIVWVLDDAQKAYAVMTTKDYTKTTQLNVAAGNVNNSDVDEFVVVGVRNNDKLRARVYNGAAKNFTRIKYISSSGSTNTKIFERDAYSTSCPAVAIADLDGDGRGELAFMQNVGGYSSAIEVLDDAEAGYKLLDSQYMPRTGSYDYDYKRPHRIVVADFEGDFIADLAIQTPDDYSGQPEGRYVIHGYQYKRRTQATGIQSKTVKKSFFIDSNKHSDAMLVAGDIDQDKRDELLLAYRVPKQVRCNQWDKDCDNGWKPLPSEYMRRRYDWKDSKPGTFARADVSLGQGDENPPILGVADVDGDNVYLQYLGEVYDTVSDPMPLVAMAPPPQFRVLMKNYHPTDPNTRLQTDGSASYGKASSSGKQTSSTVGIETGNTQTLGVGITFGKFFSFGISMSEAVEKSYTNETSQTTTMTTGLAYSGAPDSNQIVYLQTHFASYKYRILGHPDPDLRPKYDSAKKTWSYSTIFIDVPKSNPVSYNVTQAEFDKRFPEHSHWFADVFKHKAGFPETYPSKSDVDALIVNPKEGSAGQHAKDDDPKDDRQRGWWKPAEFLSVPVGGAATTSAKIELSKEKMNERRSSTKHTTGWAYEYPGSGGERGSSFSSISESSYAVMVGEEVSYAGAVGGVVQSCFDGQGLAAGPCQGLDAFDYHWNMFVYNYEHPTDSKVPPFQVIHFWVDDSVHSAHRDWYFYESFGRIRMRSPLQQKNDWRKVELGPPLLGGATSKQLFDTCELGNGKILCDDNPTLAQNSLVSGGGIGRLQAVFDGSGDEQRMFEVKVADSALDPTKAKTVVIRYRVTGTQAAIGEASLAVIPTKKTYTSATKLKLVETTLPARAASLDPIPNRKGEATNAYDTGWKTKTFDVSTVVSSGYDRLMLLLDDHDSTNGVYRLYVDYIRILK
jgi:hypothetical protein